VLAEKLIVSELVKNLFHSYRTTKIYDSPHKDICIRSFYSFGYIVRYIKGKAISVTGRGGL
jgi:hypothetical protein